MIVSRKKWVIFFCVCFNYNTIDRCVSIKTYLYYEHISDFFLLFVFPHGICQIKWAKWTNDLRENLVFSYPRKLLSMQKFHRVARKGMRSRSADGPLSMRSQIVLMLTSNTIKCKRLQVLLQIHLWNIQTNMGMICSFNVVSVKIMSRKTRQTFFSLFSNIVSFPY